MSEWLKNSSKGERIGIVLTAVLAIFILLFVTDGGSDAVEALGIFVFYFGLPVVIGWGIYWIRRAPKEGVTSRAFWAGSRSGL